jgi:hypothetical protein
LRSPGQSPGSLCAGALEQSLLFEALAVAASFALSLLVQAALLGG